MHKQLPIVSDGFLSISSAAGSTTIAVGSPAWVAWLEHPDTRSYSFQDEHGHFTARKERRKRGGEYWVAYRKLQGKLRNVYLGKSADLTLAQLTAAGAKLAAMQPTTVPREALDQRTQLLATKFHIPEPRPAFVARPRLIERFSVALHSKLMLIAGPAGFGKTMLVSEWLQHNVERKTQSDQDLEAPARRSPLGAAWVSLDAGDRDPLRFWSYVVTAIDTLLDRGGTATGAQALALLRSPQPPPLQMILLPLVNALGALPHDALLVLDDYHVIDTPAIHTSLAFLLDHLPTRLHLVILTRSDPPL